MGVDCLVDTFTLVIYLGGMGLTGLTQSLQSFIWGYEVDRLDRVTSVVYLGDMGLTGLTQSLQSFL